MRRPAPNTLQGIGLVVLALACFATLDTTTRHISTSISLLVALWFRYAIQAVITTVVVWPGRGRRVLLTRHPKFQLARGLLLFACSILAFFSLKYMPVGEFTAIALLAPLVITVFAAWKLKEKIRPLRWSLLVGGFVGTLVIIRPGTHHFDWTVVLPLTLVITNSAFQLLTSQMTKTEDPITMHFYTGWIGTILASLVLPFVWKMPTDWTVWLQLLIMGVLASIGHFLLILAYGRAPAATLTPYMYAQIAFGVLGGWVVFHHLPDQWTFMGMGLIALCGALGAWLTVHENRVTIEPIES
ncbi:EamA family transporter [Limnohabitans sp. MMS-10A-160]|uniref:DMT family transporter n=1 Tax=Limnohabitans sp. MMS-10A-192 TaxID=1835769 RepID=UPI000D3615BE|nr:DMT family transporter [Limnohabitans sp. MMS-10A-192]PUE18904.1 EamA family transporter [Limnohabitans sp. MMS-10A-192]PUE24490.1 EamA family transporter [Limnohabitans sp. MMS-10A-160]